MANKAARATKFAIEGQSSDYEDDTLGIDMGILQKVGAEEYTIRGELSKIGNYIFVLGI